MSAIKKFNSTHNLFFESCPWPRNNDIQLFRIGSCEGQWFALDNAYCIISVVNDNPGNGHLQDVFDWFENSCKRDGKALIVMELMNERFKKHLITKRGFESMGSNNAIKFFL